MEKQLKTMIENYLESRKLKGLSPETLRLDKTALNKFTAYLKAAGLEFNRVTLTDLRNYHAHLQTQGLTPALYKYLLTVKAFYRYCQQEDYLLFNPAAQLVLPKVAKKIAKIIPTPAQIRLLLAAPDLTDLTGLRDRAILELAYSSGLRIGEIINLNCHNLNFQSKEARIYGKGAKERTVPFGKSAAYYLKLYLKARPRTPNPALFQDLAGNRLGFYTLKNRYRKYNRRLGFNFTFHSLRHACALHMLQNHADIRHVQELLGHQDLTTTQIYTRLLPFDLKQAHRRSHPGEKGALPLG
jgi:integrase/recombinase XerD